MSLIVKMILSSSSLSLTLSAPVAAKTQYLVHLSFNSILLIINGISSDLQKLLKYFNGTAIVASFRIPFALSNSVFSDTLAFYKICVGNICIKISCFIFRIKHKLPVVSE